MCRFYDHQARCPRPWNCPHASSRDIWAHWLNPCRERATCAVWAEHEQRTIEDFEIDDMTRATMELNSEAGTALRILQESDWVPQTTEAQRQLRRERLQALRVLRDRMQDRLTVLNGMVEKASTRRFVWEALAGMPWYPAYVIASMVFQELFADMPWQFPVFVLWQVWEQREESARREAGPREGSR
ncbi:hypothetical protein MMC11_003429 [Xylographa trunciseda]|nr:hypothetical protein [Xylographa trunciseda]